MLSSFRSVFRRQAAFDWFVLVVWAFALRLDGSGLTSLVRLYDLAPSEYYNVLHFFHSQAFSVRDLCQRWAELVRKHLPLRRVKGRLVYLVDAIVAAKAGKCMPAVRYLHQGSKVHNRPEFVMGHFWGALTILAEAGERIFAVPLRFALHDGFKSSSSDKSTALTRAGDLVQQMAIEPGLLIADCAYVVRHLIERLLAMGFHFIGRARSTTAAYEAAVQPEKRKAGRPQKYGRKVKLSKLFAEPDQFFQATVDLYGERQVAQLREVTLYWQTLLVKFVLTVSEKGVKAIFLCTDVSMTAVEIVEGYGLRFKIEVGFRALVQTLFGFAYRFWLKGMEKTRWRQGSKYLHRAGKDYRARVARKVEAFERFVNLTALAQGLLQMIALGAATEVCRRLPLWFRTVRTEKGPSEMLVRATLQAEVSRITAKSGRGTLLGQILADRARGSSEASPLRLAG